MSKLPVAAGVVCLVVAVRRICGNILPAEADFLGVVEDDMHAEAVHFQNRARLLPERQMKVVAPLVRHGNAAEVVVRGGSKFEVAQLGDGVADALIVLLQQALGTMHVEVYPGDSFQPEVAERGGDL